MKEEVENNPELLPQRKRKGYKAHELFSHCILKGASDIRFASAIPGPHQVLLLFPLLKAAIQCLERGGQLEEITSTRAFNARGTLDNVEWHFYARVFAVTAKAVVTPMFDFLMKNNGYNMPELVLGEWKKWVITTDAMLIDGALKSDTFSKALEYANNEALTAEQRHTCTGHAVKHIQKLSASITERFGSMYGRVDVIPCGLLAEEQHQETATRLLKEVKALSQTSQKKHKRVVAFVKVSSSIHHDIWPRAHICSDLLRIIL